MVLRPKARSKLCPRRVFNAADAAQQTRIVLCSSSTDSGSVNVVCGTLKGSAVRQWWRASRSKVEVAKEPRLRPRCRNSRQLHSTFLSAEVRA